MSGARRIVIVGAGPAGVRAAETLVAAGLRPLVLDEQARCGGQIYRQPAAGAGFERAKHSIYGFEAAKAQALHTTMDTLLAHIDYQPDTLVWDCEARNGQGGRLVALRDARERNVPFSHLILATGAADRVLPIPGWTLPGVYTLGGAQTALKAQGCAIGSQIVFAGTGPLLYLVAYQYAKAGARIAAVLDTSPLAAQARALPKLARLPATLAKGLYYVGWLQAHGVRIERNVRPQRVQGERFVTGIAWCRADDKHGDGSIQTIACDALGLGFGLRPETQLADIAGCRFRFDDITQCWLPERDAAGRSSIAGIYLAGDGAGIAGADAAELAGRRAALAVLEDLRCDVMRDAHREEAASLERALTRIAVFREGLEIAFAPPFACAATWPDETIVCRCEQIDAGALRRCVRSGDATEINRLKALTRVGMGRCQGRMCGEAALALIAQETRCSMQTVGRLRAQAPIKPIPLAAALGDETLEAIPEHARDE